MSRPLRIDRAGGWYHLTGRGNERRAVFRDDRDREHFCELLGELVARFRVRLHAYVLMENHYHLMVELTEPNLSRTGQWLNLSYSVWFNRRHGRSGHLFQGRFKSVVVDPEPWGLELSRYVHLNPVRVSRMGLGKADRQKQRAGATGAPDARVVRERVSRLRQYRWSSYRAYVGLGPRPEWLECEPVLSLAGGRQGERRRNYREYVELAVREGLERSPWEALRHQVVLGSEKFVEKLRVHVRGKAREQRGVARLGSARPRLEDVIANVEKVKGEAWAEFRDRYGDEGRDLVLYVGQRACGMKLGELAAAAGMSDYKAVSMAIRRYEGRLRRSASGQALLRKVCQMSKVEM
jgi:REP element-mobilizing transposase RayT